MTNTTDSKQEAPTSLTDVQKSTILEGFDIEEQVANAENELERVEERLEQHTDYGSPDDLERERENGAQVYEERLGNLQEQLGTDIPPATRKELHETIVERRVAERERQNTEIDTLLSRKSDLEGAMLAHELLELMRTIGISLDAEQEREIFSILTSQELLETGRDRIGVILNPGGDAQLMKRIYPYRERVDALFYELFKRQLLTKEYEELLLAEGTHLVSEGEIEDVLGRTIHLKELNDDAMAALGEERLLHIVREALRDERSIARHGYFWNTLIPENVPYVMKTQRQGEKRESVHEMLYYYPIIREALGTEFLLKQAVLQSGKTNEYYIIQEKIDRTIMEGFQGNIVEEFLASEHGTALKRALERSNNAMKFQRFLDGARRLLHDHGLMIDVQGENLYMGVDSQGELMIKLVDYGCIEKRWDNERRQIKENQRILSALERALTEVQEG